jgi:exopolysaccharide production protein ExoQ
MARFALPLCLAFIVWALREDIRESPKVSPALWVPFIWVALCASKAPSLWLNPGRVVTRATEVSLEGSSLDRTIYVAIMLAALIILFKRRDRFSFPFRLNTWIYLFYIFALMSVTWSDYTGIALKRWIRAVGDLLMVLVILSEKDKAGAIERVIRRCIIVIVPLSILFIRFYRYIGVAYDHAGVMMWKGASTHKNGLGMMCAFSAVFLFWRILKSWPRPNFLDIAFFLPIAYLLVGARSSTSNVVLVLGVFMVLLAHRFKVDIQRLNVSILALGFLFLIGQGVLVGFFGKSFSTWFFSAIGRDVSFTGRLPLWTQLIKLGSAAPLGGVGYRSFWLGDVVLGLWEMFPWQPMNGHNGYIDVFLDLGLIGLAILFVLIGSTYIKTIYAMKENSGINTLLLAFLVMIISHNITETSFAMPTNLLWLFFLLIAATVLDKDAVPQVSGPAGESG